MLVLNQVNASLTDAKWKWNLVIVMPKLVVYFMRIVL